MWWVAGIEKAVYIVVYMPTVKCLQTVTFLKTHHACYLTTLNMSRPLKCRYASNIIYLFTSSGGHILRLILIKNNKIFCFDNFTLQAGQAPTIIISWGCIMVVLPYCGAPEFCVPNWEDSEIGAVPVCRPKSCIVGYGAGL